jgi:hypothetical protein
VERRRHGFPRRRWRNVVEPSMGIASEKLTDSKCRIISEIEIVLNIRHDSLDSCTHTCKVF